MVVKMIYICEYCKAQYDHAIDALKCEAGHFGLTVSQYSYWELLKQDVNKCKDRLVVADTPANQARAVEANWRLKEFEKDHIRK